MIGWLAWTHAELIRPSFIGLSSGEEKSRGGGGKARRGSTKYNGGRTRNASHHTLRLNAHATSFANAATRCWRWAIFTGLSNAGKSMEFRISFVSQRPFKLPICLI